MFEINKLNEGIDFNNSTYYYTRKKVFQSVSFRLKIH